MSLKEIHDFIKTLGDESPFYSKVKNWSAEFSRGRESVESVEDYEWSGCLKRLLQMKMLSLCTVWSCVTGEGKRVGAVQSILTDILGFSNVSARWVPRMLTKDQKKSRLDISKYLLSLYEDDPEEFMHGVVIQDETSVHHFDPDAKKHSMQ